MCHLFWQIGHFYLLFNPINTNLKEDVEILLPVKFRWILLSGFRGKFKICLSQSEAMATKLFIDRPEKHKLSRGRWSLGFCPVSLKSVQQFLRRRQKCLSFSEASVAILFSDRPDKHKLRSGHWDLASCQVWLNSVQWFQRRSRKCLSQSEARAIILFFWSARKTQTW